MADRVVDVPRLVSFHDLDDDLRHPRLKQMRRRLNDTYGGELGEPFTTAGYLPVPRRPPAGSGRRRPLAVKQAG